MDFSTVIAGGRAVTPRGVRRADVGLRAGRIAKVGHIGQRARRTARQVIDAEGCLVLPGAIDPHVHFALPIGPHLRSADDFDTGSRAALAGGVTTVIDYTTPQPGQSPLDAFRSRRTLADPAVRCDYNLHNVLIEWRLAWRAELARLKRLGAPSVKLFMIYAERGWQADDGMLYAVMQLAAKLNLTVCIHAENDALIRHHTERVQALPARQRRGAGDLALARPPLCEEEAAARAILLARATGARLHLVHLSTAGAARRVAAARRAGADVSGETCPQYLSLDARKLRGPAGHRFGCCPPLRTAAHRRGLFEQLRDGGLVAAATDHCTFDAAQKDTWQGDFTRIPYGLPGVETALALTWTLGPARERMSVERWAAIHTAGPARRFGLWPRKGSLQVGTDGDVLVWDPNRSRRIRPAKLQTTCDWNPYAGRVLTGLARHVLLRGIEVAREGAWLERPVRGKFVPRRT